MKGGSMIGLRTKTVWSGALFVVLTLGALAFAAQPAARPAKTPAATFTEDKGKLIVTVNGQTVATEDFSITRAGDHWVATGTTEFHTAHGTGRVTGELQLNNAGQPLRYVWSSEGAKEGHFHNGFCRLNRRDYSGFGRWQSCEAGLPICGAGRHPGQQPVSPVRSSGESLRLVRRRSSELRRADSAGTIAGHHHGGVRRTRHTGWCAVLRDARPHTRSASACLPGFITPAHALDGSGCQS